MDHLPESGWSIDFASNSCLFHSIIRFHFIAVGSIITAADIRLFFRFDRGRYPVSVEVRVSTFASHYCSR